MFQETFIPPCRVSPVPHESIVPILPFHSGFCARCRKMPSAMVERQMLPKQTKRTDVGSGIVIERIVYVCARKARVSFKDTVCRAKRRKRCRDSGGRATR